MNKPLKNEYSPDKVSAPGETLLEVLEDRGTTQQELAERLGMAPKTVNEIIKGKAPLTHDTALALERVLGLSAGFWNRLEAAYQESLARQRDRERLAQAQDWLRSFPIKQMVEKRYLRQRNTLMEQTEELLRFLRVASPVEWSLRASALQGYYRHSKTQDSDPNAIGAWLQRGENIARSLDCAPFDAARFHNTLEILRGYTFETQQVFLPRMVQMCQECGVAVALVPALPKASVCGFTRWLSPSKALLQLGDRYKRADMFWFTFFHEAGHILKHGKKDVFLELERGRDETEKEQEADRFAADLVISPAIYRQIVQDTPYSRAKVESWSERLGISPCLIVGRLRHEKRLPQTHLTDLLPAIDLTEFALRQGEEKEPPKTLAELFVGRMGGVHGGGKAWSEETGKAFEEAMAGKQGPLREITTL